MLRALRADACLLLCNVLPQSTVFFAVHRRLSAPDALATSTFFLFMIRSGDTTCDEWST